MNTKACRYHLTPAPSRLVWLICTASVLFASADRLAAQQVRLELQPKMLFNEAEVGDPTGLVDEQREIIGPPAGKPSTSWELNSKYWKQFPFSAYLDLGTSKNLSSIWIYDTNGVGDVVISAGSPGQWKEIATYDCAAYLKWAEVKLDVTSRYLRITRKDPGANFTEVAVYEYTDEAYREMLALREEESRRKAEREALFKKAREDALRRPLIEMAPYGTLSLVDEIDCAQENAERVFSQASANASRIETILGRKARLAAPW